MRKHVEIDQPFLKETTYVPSAGQLAEVLTTGLPT